MKKIYGFLGAMALFAMASCSDDNGVTPDVPGDNGGVKGDLYMTMNITQASSVGSRTETEDQGIEVGKDRENKITTALIIFAKPNSGNTDYDIMLTVPVGTSGASSTSEIIPGTTGENLAVFEVDRSTIQKHIADAGGSEVEYSIFVVANPTQTIIDGATGTGKTLQQAFTLTSDDDTYWSDGSFLMSSKDVVKKKITTSDCAAGTHTTASNAFPLGTVEIQRAMSRFDIETTRPHTHFEISNDVSAYKVEIDLVEVALVNQATNANLFKVTADSLAFTPSLTATNNQIKFAAETKSNWVWSNWQSTFLTPLFGTGAATNGKLSGDRIDLSTLEYKSLTDDVTEADNTFTHTGSNSTNERDYRIWRYCMENTNPDVWNNQVNGNSTGVVFKAKMTATKAGANVEVPVYAYNSVIIGTFEDLVTYVKSPKHATEDPGIYEMVQIRWNAAINAYNTAHPDSKFDTTEKKADGVEDSDNWWGSEDNADTLEGTIKEYLVQQEFSIFTPVGETGQKVFYCYYIYWNRHNDNGKETQMGAMEFATVRNNVYKLRVTGINRLGHPGEPGNDPDDPTPDTPDEKDHYYLSVECKVLPWEVRINDIIF